MHRALARHIGCWLVGAARHGPCRARHRRDRWPSSSGARLHRRSQRKARAAASRGHQARAAAGRARVGGGRRVRAQRGGYIELQRHRDRHLRRRRQQPAAERRVGLLRCHRCRGGRARPAGRAAQGQRCRPLAQHLLCHLRQRAELLRRRLHASDRRDRARGVPHAARRRLQASAVSRLPSARASRSPARTSRSSATRSCASSRRTASTSIGPTACIFTGKSLFRASILLPANVTVGPFDTRVYLFREEKLLSRFTVRLTLEREGLERHLHAFAYRLPMLYGIVTVMIAVGAGLLASTVFRKATHSADRLLRPMRVRASGVPHGLNHARPRQYFNPRTGTAWRRGRAPSWPSIHTACRRCRTAAGRRRRAR